MNRHTRLEGAATAFGAIMLIANYHQFIRMFLVILLCATVAYGASVSAKTFDATGGMPLEPLWAPVSTTAPLLIAGVQFDEARMPEESCEWYIIPEWFAGTWQREFITTTRTYNHTACTESSAIVESKATSTDDEGWQKDNRGRIWNCDHTPFRSESDCGDSKQIFIVTSLKPLEVTEEKLVKQFEGTGYIVDKKTNKVIRSVKARSIQTYRKQAAGRIEVSSVTTELDINGVPMITSKAVTTYTQIEGFKPHDFHNGKDMRVSFKDYLDSHGKADLVPTAIGMAQ